ncbi:tryptophan-rich sensory protein [Lysobacter sp. TY2-98]|nr:tryptophan-rich sensory protein [Lysobacter sp. TY2-98]
MHPVAGFVAWMAVTFVAAAAGAAASVDAAPFYAALVRPSWAPPSGLFGPVWTLLYALMGVAVWWAWRHGASRRVLGLYVVQLVANALWSWLFFAWHRGALAFVDILVLWCLIVATAVGLWRVRPLSGALLLPYLAWVTFASALNWAVWHLNPAVLGA